jgi:hypothetical protein
MHGLEALDRDILVIPEPEPHDVQHVGRAAAALAANLRPPVRSVALRGREAVARLRGPTPTSETGAGSSRTAPRRTTTLYRATSLACREALVLGSTSSGLSGDRRYLGKREMRKLVSPDYKSDDVSLMCTHHVAQHVVEDTVDLRNLFKPRDPNI